MCAMGKKDLVSCQISYFPLDSDDYIKEVDHVLALIADSELQSTVGPQSTTVTGESEKVLHLIRRIHAEMTDNNYKYSMNIMLSNINGCE